MSTFSQNQQEVYNSYLEGKNIFVSGPGGTGKSYLIKKIYQDAKSKDKDIKVTSLTGCSAVLLGCNAVTIHKWSGLGIAKETDMLKVMQKLRRYKTTKKYEELDILVIDEISMMAPEFFEMLDHLFKRIRKNDFPFGGVQLICSGDFFQLPPINKERGKETKFCFESGIWNETFHDFILLNKNFRQKEDDKFFNILQNIRLGNINHEDYELLLSCTKKDVHENDIKPTIIFPTKRQADEVNFRELKSLTGQEQSFKYDIYKENDEGILTKQLQLELTGQINNSMCEEELVLKVGSQVMCISNIDQELGIVNGAQGIVLSFEINKETNELLPLVKFENIGHPVVIKQHTWKNEKFEKFGIRQIPLILSWAITIHKSQGLTLDKAFIDIGNNIFECGQTYVALSRVKSLDGLYLKNINIHKIKAHSKVVKFYKNNMISENNIVSTSLMDGRNTLKKHMKDEVKQVKKKNPKSSPKNDKDIRTFFNQPKISK